MMSSTAGGGHRAGQPGSQCAGIVPAIEPLFGQHQVALKVQQQVGVGHGAAGEKGAPSSRPMRRRIRGRGRDGRGYGRTGARRAREAGNPHHQPLIGLHVLKHLNRDHPVIVSVVAAVGAKGDHVSRQHRHVLQSAGGGLRLDVLALRGELDIAVMLLCGYCSAIQSLSDPQP